MRFDPSSLVYNADGLIPVIAQDAGTKDVLMFAWMNAEAVAKTLESGQMTYWSRSRQAFWVKGETSGHRQGLVEMRLDCDRDCLLALVDQTNPLRMPSTRLTSTARALSLSFALWISVE